MGKTKKYEVDIENADVAKQIEGNKVYAISGMEIINLDQKAEKLKSALRILKYQLREALNGLANDSASFPKFVANVGQILDNVNDDYNQYLNQGWFRLAVGMKIAEAKPCEESNV